MLHSPVCERNGPDGWMRAENPGSAVLSTFLAAAEAAKPQ